MGRVPCNHGLHGGASLRDRVLWLRHGARQAVSARSGNARLRKARDAFLRGWHVAPVWVRTFLGSLALIGVLASAILSGVVLWVIAFLPFVAKTAVGLFVIKYLAHFAAARGVSGLAPLLWRFIPERFRLWVERRYRHLWWWTMRRIVRNRRRMVHRVWRRRSKEAALPTAKASPL